MSGLSQSSLPVPPALAGTPTLPVARAHGIPALILAMLPLPTLLHAQENPGPSDQLDAIVVTARFRPESAQNVGESIRAFDKQELQDLGINPWNPGRPDAGSCHSRSRPESQRDFDRRGGAIGVPTGPHALHGERRSISR